MKSKSNQITLISNPGLTRYSLVSYFRELGVTNIHIIKFESIDYLLAIRPAGVDKVFLLEEGNPREVEHALKLLRATHYSLGVFVQNINRQRELSQKTDADVIIWGGDHYDFEQFLEPSIARD